MDSGLAPAPQGSKDFPWMSATSPSRNDRLHTLPIADFIILVFSLPLVYGDRVCANYSCWHKPINVTVRGLHSGSHAGCGRASLRPIPDKPHPNINPLPSWHWDSRLPRPFCRMKAFTNLIQTILQTKGDQSLFTQIIRDKWTPSFR